MTVSKNPVSASLGKSALVVGGGILFSRVLGLARDMIFADIWGTGTAFAAFSVAFTIPNLLRALFGEGAFSAAFVPLLSERLERSGRARAARAAERILSVLMVVVGGIVLAAIIGAFGASALFGDRMAPRLALTFQLLPAVMPYALLICLAGGVTGILNALRRFALPAVVPAVLNIVLIAATVGICPYWGESPEERVRALGLAVLLAGVLQLGILLFSARRAGAVLHFRPAFGDEDVRRVAGLMLPAMIGTGVAQLNVAVDRALALWLGSDAVTSLYYSQRLVYLPVGLFGVAMGVVALPSMSRACANRDPDAMRRTLSYSLRHVLFLSLPAAILLMPAAAEVVRLLFERGQFGAESTAATVFALMFYLPGIPAFACAKVAVAPFYARKDTKTPVKIAAVCLVLNVVLNLLLMQFIRQGGLALATTLCSFLNVILLLRLTVRDLGAAVLKPVGRSLLRNGAAAGAGAVVVRLTMAGMARLSLPAIAEGRFGRAIFPLLVGGVAYLVLSRLFGATETGELLGSLRRRNRPASLS